MTAARYIILYLNRAQSYHTPLFTTSQRLSTRWRHSPACILLKWHVVLIFYRKLIMSSRLDFYFDFSSPYGYFASTRINELAKKYNCLVDWHPFAGDTFKPSISGTSLVQSPAKRVYMQRDYVRSANFHQIPFKVPTVFPLETRVAARAVMWVESKFGGNKSIELAQAIFHAYYVDDKNIGDPVALAEIGASIGLDADDLTEGMNDALTKEQARAEIDLATAKGVFGSPFVLLDGEPFWGFDRFDQLEAALQAKSTS